MSQKFQNAHLIVILAILALPAAQSTAGEKDGVRFTFKAFHPSTGVFYQTVKTRAVQVMTVENMTIKQEQMQVFYYRYVPQQIDADGNFVVRQQILAVKMDIQIGGNRIPVFTFDKPKDNDPLDKFLRTLTEFDVELTVDRKTRRVIKISGLKEFVSRMRKEYRNLAPLTDTMLSAKAVMKSIEPFLDAFPPDGNHRIGFSWSHRSKLNLGPVGTLLYDSKYRFVSLNDRKAIIEVKPTVKWELPQPRGGRLPFLIRNGKLQNAKATGKVVIDLSKGWVESHETNVKLVGNMQIMIGGKRTDVTLEQTQTMRLANSARNPLAELLKKK